MRKRFALAVILLNYSVSTRHKFIFAPWFTIEKLRLRAILLRESQVDECPSGLRSTPRKRVRVKSSASSNLASSANNKLQAAFCA